MRMVMDQSLCEDTQGLDVRGVREQVERLEVRKAVAGVDQLPSIARERGDVARHVHERLAFCAATAADASLDIPVRGGSRMIVASAATGCVAR